MTLIRQAGDRGSLYGSVSSRDIAEGATAGGLGIDRGQVELDHPIKTLGVRQVRVVLHPEVVITITVNVARCDRGSREAAARRGGGPCGVKSRADVPPISSAPRKRPTRCLIPALSVFVKKGRENFDLPAFSCCGSFLYGRAAWVAPPRRMGPRLVYCPRAGFRAAGVVRRESANATDP